MLLEPLAKLLRLSQLKKCGQNITTTVDLLLYVMRDPVCRLLRQHAPVNLSTKDQFSTQHKTRKHRLIFTEILLPSSASFVIWEPAAYLDRVLLESSLAMNSSASLFVCKHAQRTIALRVVPSNMTTSAYSEKWLPPKNYNRLLLHWEYRPPASLGNMLFLKQAHKSPKRTKPS